MTSLKQLPDLDRSYKACYPFRLATTSFIYPDTWIPNVDRLGPYVDEIELLILEKGKNNYPTEKEIKTLSQLAKKHDLTYNIHLPMDIELGHSSALKRTEAVDVVRQVMELTDLLPVSVHVIHADFPDAPLFQTDPDSPAVAGWRDRAKGSFDKLIASGINAPFLAVETLENYPLDWIAPVIFDLNLSVCLDFGHLWLSGLDPLAYYRTFKKQTRILHLHGVKHNKDHQALDTLDSRRVQIVKQILDEFREVVSLEVFSYANLAPSLTALESIWHKGVGQK